MLTATFLGYAGLGAMNLDTDAAGGDKGQGGPVQQSSTSVFKIPTPTGSGFFNTIKQAMATGTPKPGFFDTVKQAFSPPGSTIVKVTRSDGRTNTIVPVTPARTNTIVPLTKPPSIFTPPKPITVSIKTAPGPIPTQGIVCVVPSGPGWVILWHGEPKFVLVPEVKIPKRIPFAERWEKDGLPMLLGRLRTATDDVVTALEAGRG